MSRLLISRIININKRYPGDRFWVVPLLSFLIGLLPYTVSGFYFDDVINSLVSGKSIYTDQSVWILVKEQLQLWVVNNGRFYPIAIIAGYPIWEFCDTLVKYRILHLSFILLNAHLFCKLTSCITGSNKLAYLGLICMPMLFQFNPRWDPITSFGPLNQLVLTFIFAAWLLILHYYKQQKIHFLILSLICQILALCTYEVGLVVLPGVFILTWLHGNVSLNAIRRVLLSSAAVTILYLFAYYYFYITRVSHYEGSSVSLIYILPTLLAQIASALPLGFLENKVLGVTYDGALLVLLIIVFSIISYCVLRRAQHMSYEEMSHVKRVDIATFSLGAILLIIPSLIISISDRYQKIVTYGDPYIVVYLSYWGVAILISILLKKVLSLSHWRFGPAFILAIFISVTSSVTVNANLDRIERKNAEFKVPRVQMEQIIRAGFLKDIANGSELVVDSPYSWESGDAVNCSNFFSLWAGKPIHCLPLSQFVDRLSASIGSIDNLYYLRRSKGTDGEAVVELIGGGKIIRASHRLDRVHFVSKSASNVDLLVGPTLHGGFYGWEGSEDRWSWSGGNGQLHFIYLGPVSEFMNINFSLLTPIDREIKWISDTDLSAGKAALLANHLTSIEFKVMMSPGINVISVLPEGPTLRLSDTDTRDFSFRIERLHVD